MSRLVWGGGPTKKGAFSTSSSPPFSLFSLFPKNNANWAKSSFVLSLPSLFRVILDTTMSEEKKKVFSPSAWQQVGKTANCTLT